MSEKEEITHEEAVKLLRKLVDEAGSSKAAANRLGISQSYLSDILAGSRPVSDNVAQAIGYRRVLRYEKLP